MFLDFYQMREEPFGVTPDPRFLYLSESHREALASLLYGIESDRGFMMLVAHPGFGKTTLIFQLIEKLQPDARTVFLFQTQCNSRELMQYLLNELGVDIDGMETVTMHKKLNQILTQERQAGRRFILIVDEAHNLDPGVLETIRLLSTFETSSSKLLQILLVGRPQLARKVAGPSLEQLQQRISLFAKLEPFGPEETARYITHRLKVAGYAGAELFTSGAKEIIAQRSQGIPRNINRLCFSALTQGCALGRKRIDSEIMRAVVADLGVAPSQEEAASDLFTPLPRGGRAAKNAVARAIAHPVANGRLFRPAMAIGSAAAVIAIAAGLFAYSHGRLSGFLPAANRLASLSPAQVSSSVVPAVQAQAATPAAIQFEQTRDVPWAPTAPPPSPTLFETPARENQAGEPESEPATVRVRPGETLKQIALRVLGQDDSDLIKKIQQLNPRIKDPDHIEIDQEIRLPRLTNGAAPSASASVDDPSRAN